MATHVLKGTTNITPPWDPPETTIGELAAIKAMVEGAASKEQQALVVKWLEKATGVAEMEFRPAGERESAFAAGKRFVGLQFFTLAKTTLPDPRHGS